MAMRTIFPIPLVEADLPGHALLNRELSALLRRRRDEGRDYAPYSTVNGGWQSAPDLLADPDPAVVALREHIGAEVAEMVAALRASCGEIPDEPVIACSGWGVILGPGGGQSEHVHRRADFVAVYYVEVGDEAGGGELVFSYPRSGGTSVYSIWERFRLAIAPRPGRLLLFPAFLPHHVERYHGPGDRISINVDVTVRPGR